MARIVVWKDTDFQPIYLILEDIHVRGKRSLMSVTGMPIAGKDVLTHKGA